MASPLTRANPPFATIVIVALFSVPLSEIKNSSCVACGTPLKASKPSISTVDVTPVRFEPSPTKPPLALITPLAVMCELALMFPETFIPVVVVSNFVELLCFNNVPAPSVNSAIVLPSVISLTLTTLPLIFKAPVPESLILLLLPSWNICKSLPVPSCILLASFNFIPPNEPVNGVIISPLELISPATTN